MSNALMEFYNVSLCVKSSVPKNLFWWYLVQDILLVLHSHNIRRRSFMTLATLGVVGGGPLGSDVTLNLVGVFVIV